jgi:hypothetical protein
LAKRSSLVALLFRLDQSRSRWVRRGDHLAATARRIRAAASVVHPSDSSSARGALGETPESINLLEDKGMLADQIGVWMEGWCAEGEVKGWAESLICVLGERFGVLAPSWEEQIQGAELVTLQHWFKRAIAASDLPSVFDSPR